MSQQQSNGSSRRPPKEGAASHVANGKDSEWGFERKDEEKTLEPRLGVVLVACLLLVFGFVLYNKYQQAKETSPDQLAENMGEKLLTEGVLQSDRLKVAESSPQSLANMSPNGVAESERRFDPFGGKSSPEPTVAERSPASDSASSSFNPFSTEEGVAANESPSGLSASSQVEPSPFDDDPFPASAGPSPAGDMELADEASLPPQDELVFDLDPASMTQNELQTEGDAPFDPLPNDQQVADSSSNPDPFGGTFSPDRTGVESAPVDQQEPEPLESMDLAMPLSPQSAEPDPFAGADVSDTSPRQAQVEPNPFGDVAELSDPSATHPNSEIGFPDDELPAQAKQENLDSLMVDPKEPVQAPALPVLPTTIATPETVAQADAGWELEPVPTSRDRGPADQQSPPGTAFGGLPELTPRPLPSPPFSASEPESVAGERELTVSKNDSLWSIAQDAYGTARYVSALAAYNKDRVPHPDKLKVGVKLRIPPPEVLETRFPNMFRTTNRRDSMISPAGGQSLKSSTTAQPGLFTDREGRPICRVGEDDTLSSIAQRYLGRSSRWTDIYGMNDDQLKSPESLKPGMILRLPPDAGHLSVDGKNDFGR